MGEESTVCSQASCINLFIHSSHFWLQRSAVLHINNLPTPDITVEPSVGVVGLIQRNTDEGRCLLENLSEMLTKAALLLLFYPAVQVLWLGMLLCLALVGYRHATCVGNMRRVLWLSPSSCELVLCPAAQDLWLGSCYISYVRLLGMSTCMWQWEIWLLWAIPYHYFQEFNISSCVWVKNLSQCYHLQRFLIVTVFSVFLHLPQWWSESDRNLHCHRSHYLPDWAWTHGGCIWHRLWHAYAPAIHGEDKGEGHPASHTPTVGFIWKAYLHSCYAI